MKSKKKTLKSKKQKPAFPWLFWGGIGVLVLGVLFFLGIEKVGVINIREVDIVTDNQSLQKELGFLKEKYEGEFLLRFSLDDVYQEVSVFPEVKHCQIEKVWPHTVRICLELREGRAYFRYKKMRWLIDEDHIVYKKEDISALPKGLPIVYGFSHQTEEEMTIGKKLPQRFSKIMGILEYAEKIALNTVMKITGLEVIAPTVFALYTEDGKQILVVWGSYRERLRKLYHFIQRDREKWERARGIDLRFGSIKINYENFIISPHPRGYDGSEGYDNSFRGERS